MFVDGLFFIKAKDQTQSIKMVCQFEGLWFVVLWFAGLWFEGLWFAELQFAELWFAGL